MVPTETHGQTHRQTHRHKGIALTLLCSTCWVVRYLVSSKAVSKVLAKG